MSVRDEDFLKARDKILGSSRYRKGIGTLGEKTLHAVLKEFYEPDADSQEVKIGSYVADIVGENDVTVVYPVARVKYLSWLDEETGELSKPRKSPKSPDEFSVFRELYSLRKFINHPHFHFVVCFLEVLEIKSLNGWSKDKKRGAVRFDRIPQKLLGELCLYSREDYRQFVPVRVEKDFTSAEFALAIGKSRETARELLYVLEAAELVLRTGKKGNNILYSVNDL